MPIVKLSADQRQIIQELDVTNDSYFITGKAGTGKSTILKTFLDTTSKNVVCLAPTGIAALNIGGQTIHSFFGFPSKLITSYDIRKRRQTKLYQNIDTIVIDEISMVRCEVLDNIDHFLKIHRENDLPFGGVQMIFFGDVFQLPPVTPRNEAQILFQMGYQSPYFFSSEVFQQVDFHFIELNEAFRQKDGYFIKLLDKMRMGLLEKDEYDFLNKRYFQATRVDDQVITLSPHRYQVDSINKEKLTSIDEKPSLYAAEVEGKFTASTFPTEQVLQLKEGAQVMILKNDVNRLYSNGTIGVVKELKAKEVIVEIQFNGKPLEVTIEPHSWNQSKYKVDDDNPKKVSTETVGKFKQIPLRLAWAITIHKSQGLTYDELVIDFGRGAFAFGQAYVAFSRSKTLQGITLKQPVLPKDVKVDKKVLDFYFTYF